MCVMGMDSLTGKVFLIILPYLFFSIPPFFLSQLFANEVLFLAGMTPKKTYLFIR